MGMMSLMCVNWRLHGCGRRLSDRRADAPGLQDGTGQAVLDRAVVWLRAPPSPACLHSLARGVLGESILRSAAAKLGRKHAPCTKPDNARRYGLVAMTSA